MVFKIYVDAVSYVSLTKSELFSKYYTLDK